MHNVKLTIEYAGTSYSGWQSQKNNKTVQGEIQKAIFKFSGERVVIQGAGRTDAGVHAIGQCANYIMNKEYTEYQVLNGINFHLGIEKIRISKVEFVNMEFNARFTAKIKTYHYQVVNRAAPIVIDSEYVLHIREMLDIKNMNKAAKFLVGKHDFSSFRARDCQANSPVKTLEQVKIKKLKERLFFEFSARSFLHQQIRIMVGTILNIGVGKDDPKKIKYLLGKKDRKLAGPTAPAKGLTLIEIKY